MSLDKNNKGVDFPSLPWQVIDMRDFAAPVSGSASALKKRWQSLGRLFQDTSSSPDLARDEAELRLLPPVRLANIVPPIDWGAASTALATALDAVGGKGGTTGFQTAQAALSARADDPVRFFVGPPFCNHPAILCDWANHHRAQVLTPPSATQILAGDVRWLDMQTPIPGSFWVLPALERCFLRHSNGLDLLRNFLERALSGALGPGIIGCDSWAFAFVQRLWPLPGTPVLTLQAFDGPALADYFVRTPRLSLNGRPIRFLSARSGEPLVPDDKTDTSADHRQARDEPEQALPEMCQLAAHCHGNPGLAWHHWRKQLRTEPDYEPPEQTQGQIENQEAGQQQGGREKSGPSDDIIWVAPDLESPSLPAETGEVVAFILHALLLHRGLSADLLALVLSMPRSQVLTQLLGLQAMDLLIREDDFWLIAPLAYPSVRGFLRVRAHLTDAF